MTDDQLREQKALAYTLRTLGACDTECGGRCELCPDDVAQDGAAVIDALCEEVGRLREALREIARQKTMGELQDVLDGCDFDYAYDKIIEVARSALSTTG